MKNIFLFTISIILFNISMIAQSALVDIPITVSDGAGGNATLQFGLDPMATDSIDAIIGEQVLPPMPPDGVFDARFNLPTNTDASLKDYRHGSTSFRGNKTHELQYQTGTGTQIIIGWNLPKWVTGRLQDEITGALVDEMMADTGNYAITNLAINKLKLTITYAPMVPPSAPILSTPRNSSVNIPIVPTFKWYKSTIAATYRLQIAMDAGYSNIVYNDSTITDSIKVSPSALLVNTKYYWRVNAKNTNGTSEWSDGWSFTTTSTLTAQVDIPIIVSDGAGGNVTLRFGSDPIATDGIDAIIGEQVLPPMPPAGVFDARFHLPTGDESWLDYRASAKDSLEWLIKFQLGSGDYHFTFVWDNTKLPKGSIYLKDIITGSIVNVNMKTNSSYTLTNPGINELAIELNQNVDDVKDTQNLPVNFSLSQNYPNPFNPTTAIRYGLGGVSNVKIKIYNLLGQEVESLVNGTQDAGYHEVNWNASNQPSGIYLYSIEAGPVSGKGSFHLTKKLILMK